MDNEPAICLVDNTISSRTLSDQTSQTPSISRPATVAKLLTVGSVRSEISKRRYAKWQPDSLGLTNNNGVNKSSQDSTFASGKTGERRSREFSSGKVVASGTVDAPSSTADEDHAEEAQEDTHSPAELTKEIDVLYENQRGFFFFGMPFYSHRSLLQWDHPAWMNSEFKESPVDVRNAQVPDPSWVWVWRTWYVDMSNDVDENGWQYSFAFHARFGWHGTHPPLHSFVRRRRWIRLRAKIYGKKGRPELESAHTLNEDYFTIHLKQLRSRASSIYADHALRSGSTHNVGAVLFEGVPLEDIKDIPTLMQALKVSLVDRERIEALKKFVAQGGEELRYLDEKVPEIISMFVFYTSRWQFLQYLRNEADAAAQHQGSGTEVSKEDFSAIKRKGENLARAAKAVRSQISGYEIFDVWDRELDGRLGWIDAGKDASHPRAEVQKEEFIGIGSNQIRGIPKEAGIGQEPHIY